VSSTAASARKRSASIAAPALCARSSSASGRSSARGLGQHDRNRQADRLRRSGCRADSRPRARVSTRGAPATGSSGAWHSCPCAGARPRGRACRSSCDPGWERERSKE
jgi:hypothetical protein